MTKPIDYSKLPTERVNRASRHIDQVSIRRALDIINREDFAVPRAVRRALPAMEKAVVIIAASLKKGGKLLFMGAGTSGRLGIMEAAECPPTFNTPPSMIQAVMAGGKSSVFKSKEGAEDRGDEAKREVRARIRKGDVVVGIAASGITPFVHDGLRAAKALGAKTIFVTCHSKPPTIAHVTISIPVGPEVIAGSTRLKAATATKLVLNSLSVASMVQLGKVYGNRMVDLQPKNRKLVERAVRLIGDLGRVSENRARQLLSAAGGNAKTAIVMAKTGATRMQAITRLRNAAGLLKKALN